MMNRKAEMIAIMEAIKTDAAVSQVDGEDLPVQPAVRPLDGVIVGPALGVTPPPPPPKPPPPLIEP